MVGADGSRVLLWSVSLFDLLCLGDVALDVYPDATYPGGCSLNVARHLHALSGGRVESLGVMAPVHREEQRFFEEPLERSSITLHRMETSYPTPRCYVEVDEQGERSFPRYDAAALVHASVGPTELQVLKQYQHVLTVLYEESEALVRSLVASEWDGSLFLDFSNLSGFHSDVAIMRELAGRLTVGFCGLEHHQRDLIRDIQVLSEESGTSFVVTLGSRGSVAFYEGRRIEQAAFPVEQVVDSTGAGDSFIAAFLFHFLQNNDIKVCLQEASKYAAQTLQYEGAFRSS
ncbi:MAG: hypothetical protein EP343_12130 [Deltaproteobacteria bacterium]|nr:MAG: hypothetical protein EP343_12130 [Deltaproteobacteria bacterium]